MHHPRALLHDHVLVYWHGAGGPSCFEELNDLDFRSVTAFPLWHWKES
jgi:hypothetical protein